VSLSDREIEHLERCGFVRIPGVVSTSLTEGVLEALRDRFALRVDDPRSWQEMPVENCGVVPLHHHQALWDLRQYPSLYETFRGIWGTGRLTVSVDRPSFHPPSSTRPWDVGHHRLHWDFDPSQEHRELQGLVYLTDASEMQGAFRCSPELYAKRAEWLSRQPAGVDPRFADLSGAPTVAVPGRAGDLIIWRPQLPHAAGPNLSKQVRAAQCVSMFPGVPTHERREWASWLLALRPPPWWRGLTGQADPEPGPAPRLTPLGRRLAGLDEWPPDEP
jgi:hypothetical protein